MDSLPDLSRRLRTALRQPLPGAAAQYAMAHQLRESYGEAPADAARAGVLVLLLPTAHSTDPHLVFIRRTSHDPRDRHAGQISFPGGRVEDEDADMAATALREAEEEIGIPRERVEVLGPLTPLFIPVSNFLVFPLVGMLSEPAAYIPQTSEVAEVIELPLADFQLPGRRKLMDKKLPNGLMLTDMPYYDFPGTTIWGATAMMTSELLAVMQTQQV